MADNETGGNGVAFDAKRAWFTTAILFVLTVISILDRNIVTLLVDVIKAHFGLTDTEMGLLIGAAFSVPFGIMIIPIGWAVDRFERRTIIAIGVLTWSLATIATGLARSFGALFAARSLIGAGDATLGPANASLVSDLFPRDRLALPMAVTTMGVKAGGGAALILGAAMTVAIAPSAAYVLPVIGTLKGWQLIFLIVALPGIVLAPLVFTFREPAREAVRRQGDSGHAFIDLFRFMLVNKAFFLPLAIGYLLVIAMSTAVASWMPAFLIRAHGWSAGMAGSWLGAALLLGPLLGMPLHGALADRFCRRGWSDIHMRYPMVAAIVGTPFAIAAFLVPSPEMAVILMGLFLFTVSGYASLILTALMGVTPGRLRGKMISIAGLVCGTTGLALGPLVVGTLTDRVYGDPKQVGLSIMTSMAIMLPIIIGCFALTLRPMRRMVGGKA